MVVVEEEEEVEVVVVVAVGRLRQTGKHSPVATLISITQRAACRALIPPVGRQQHGSHRCKCR